MSGGKTISGFYAGSDYFGWTGATAKSETMRKHFSSKGYLVKDGRVYQKFPTASEYVEWWCDRWKEAAND